MKVEHSDIMNMGEWFKEHLTTKSIAFGGMTAFEFAEKCSWDDVWGVFARMYGAAPGYKESQLNSELTELKEQLRHNEDARIKLQSRVNAFEEAAYTGDMALKEKLRKAVECIEWYADKNSWYRWHTEEYRKTKISHPCIYSEDWEKIDEISYGGLRARAVLADLNASNLDIKKGEE